MTQLAFAFPPTSPFIDDHVPTFMAENTTTLLALAADDHAVQLDLFGVVA